MTASFLHAQAVLKFASLDEADWLPLAIPIPSGVVLYTSDLKLFKVGDGTRRYRDLPIGASVTSINNNANEFEALVKLTPLHDDKIIIAQDGVYTPSSMKVSEVNALLTAIENKKTNLNTTISTIVDKFTMVSTSIGPEMDGMVALSKNQKMAPGFRPDDLVTSIFTTNPLTIRNIEFFEDVSCLYPVDTIYEDTTYYVRINAQHDTAERETISYNLISDNINTVISLVDTDVFEVTTPRFDTPSTLRFTGGVIHNDNSASYTQTFSIMSTEDILITIYNSPGNDSLSGSAVSNNDFSAIVGYTEHAPDDVKAFVLRMNSKLTIARRYKCQRSLVDKFNDIAILNNKYYVVGSTLDNDGNEAMFISRYSIYFDHESTKYLPNTVKSRFTRIIATNGGNLLAIGTRGDAGSTECCVYKFNQDLDLLNNASLNRSLDDVFLDVHMNTNSQTFVIGHIYDNFTSKKNGIVFKLGTLLNVTDACVISSAYDDVLTEVKSLPDGSIVCIGNTYSKGPSFPTYCDGFVVKLDSTLNVVDQVVLKVPGCDDVKLVALIVGVNGQLHVIGNGLRSGIREGLLITLNSDLEIVVAKSISSTYDVIFKDAVFKNDFMNCSGEILLNGTDKAPLFLRLERTIDIDTVISTATDLTIANTPVTTEDSWFLTNDTMITLSENTPTFVNDSFITSLNTDFSQIKDIISV